MPEVAAAVIDAPMPAPKPASYYAPAPVKLEGTAMKKVLKIRIIDADKVGREWCSPDNVKLNAQLKMSGLKSAELIGGIEVYEDESLAVTARK